MSYGLINGGRRIMWAAALVLGCGGTLSADAIITSKTIYATAVYPNPGTGNPPVYGDFRTGAGNITAPAGQPSQSGWRYSDANSATIGINTTYAHDGNGSAYLSVANPTGAGGGVGKATVQYSPGGSIGGTLSQLTTLQYDWYRDSDSTVAAHLTPSFRLLLRGGFLGAQSRTLVFETVYNGTASAATDTWVAYDALNDHASNRAEPSVWATNAPSTYKSLSQWVTELGSWNVVGFEIGVGSGWRGTFIGAADNVSIGFTASGIERITNYNFEVAGVPAPVVPEPSSVVMGLIAGAAGLVMAARRRRAS